jgi:hypothetical protein
MAALCDAAVAGLPSQLLRQSREIEYEAANQSLVEYLSVRFAKVSHINSAIRIVNNSG